MGRLVARAAVVVWHRCLLVQLLRLRGGHARLHMPAAAAAAVGTAAGGRGRVWEGSREVAESLIEVHQCVLVYLHVAVLHDCQQLVQGLAIMPVVAQPQ